MNRYRILCTVALGSLFVLPLTAAVTLAAGR